MSWIITHTGKKIYPADLQPDDYDIEDIAHALSNLCRYTGHTKKFYSVAEHSVHVSFFVPKEYAMLGLLHDAPEAYLSDINRPLKMQLPKYQDIELDAELALIRKFGLPNIWPGELADADYEVGFNEMRDLLDAEPSPEWMPENPRYIDLREPWPPEVAKRAFLDRYDLLMLQGESDIIEYGADIVRRDHVK